MDLPPPPPFFPPPDHHRYDSDFIHHHNHRDLRQYHLVPPPHVLSGHRFAFSPPHDFDLPPPNRDYLVRSHNFRDDVYFRDNNNNTTTSLFDLDMRQRFNDVGRTERFRDSLYRDDVIERRWDFNNEGRYYDVNNRQVIVNDDRRMGDFGVSDRVHEFYRERVEYERRRVNERWLMNDERQVLGFDRFSGRLGRRVCDDENVVRDSKKRRVQKTREVDRNEVVGKAFNNNNKRRRGNNFENVSKEGKCTSVRGGKGKERIETRKEDKKEREQSPLELSISFESNGLVARAILTPPSVGKSNMGSTRSKGYGKVNGPLLSKSEMDMVKVGVLNCQFDAESDANGNSESNISESGRWTTKGTFEDLKAEGTNIVGSQPSDSWRLEEMKDTSLEEDLAPSAVSDTRTTDVTSDFGVTAAANDSLGDIKSQGTNHIGYWRARTRRLRKIRTAMKKRLRISNFGTTNDSSKILIDNTGSSSGTLEHDTNIFLSKTNEVPDAVLLPSTVAVSKKVDHESDFSMFAKFPCNTETLVSITKDADFECQSGKDEVACCANEAILDDGNDGDGSVLSKHLDDANMCVPNSDNISFRTYRDDDFMHCPFQDIVYPSSSQEPVNFSVSEANCSVLENIEGEAYNRVAVADCSDVNLDALADSTFISVEQLREGEVDLSHSNGSVEKFMEATETSPDRSPNFMRKRKASYDQIDLSSLKTNENLFTLSGKIFSKDCSSSERVDLPRVRNRCVENETSSEGPSEDASSYKNLDFGSGVDVLSCKKKKVDSARSISMSIDGFHRDQSELDLGYHVPPDCEAGRWKDVHSDSTTAIYRCDATDIDIKVEEDNLFSADTDNIYSHEETEKLHVNGDELDYVDNLFSDKNVDNAYSGDEQADSDSDELSCPSSPEDLLLFSDFSSPLNTNASPSLSRNDIIYGTGRTFNRRAVSADRLGKATSYSAHTNRSIPSPVTFPMVEKSNFTHGKLMMSKNQPSSTASKAFTAYPQKCSNPKALPSTQVSKSKTWRRTGSVADTTPKLKPSLPPQVHTMKMSGPTQNSYVRKGNSLMRTPSPSSAPSPELHASSSSVYRASPSIDGLKKCQSFKTTADVPSLPRKPSPSSVISPGFHASSSLGYRASPSIDGLKKGQAFRTTVDTPGLQRKPSLSSVISPGFNTSSSYVYKASPSTDGLKKGQAIVDAPSLPRKPSPSSAISPGFHPSSSSAYRASLSIAGLSNGQAYKTIVDTIVDTPSLQRKPSPSNAISPGFHTVSSTVYRLSPSTDNLKKDQTSKNRVDGDAMSILQRKPSPSSVTSSGFNALRSSVYRLSPSSDGLTGLSSNPCPVVNTSVRTESLSLGHGGKSTNPTSNTGKSSPVNFDILCEATKSCPISESRNSLGSHSVLDIGKSEKKITYVKRKSNQLVAASDSEDTSTSGLDKTRQPLSGSYYKSKKNQLVRTPLENQSTISDAMVDVNLKFGSQVYPPKSSRKRQLGKGKGSQKTFRSSKFSLVWKLQEDAQSSDKQKVSERPKKMLSRLFPWKRATYRRSFLLALGSKPNNKPFSSQKMFLSRKRGAVYTRSSHGYSLKMSKVFSVGGSSLKWSKSLEKNSKKVNEDATQAVAAAEKKKKEENITGAINSKTRSRVYRKLVLNVKLRPGERIFRIGSERYKMDPTRRTLRRITEENTSPSSAPHPSEKNVKISYVPRRLFIGSNEYVRIGNGNQLVRDPKKRTRVLASEKVRWSLRTARLRWAKKKKYCQFFTKFGKCNKEDGKCMYIHDQTKIVVCTKFLNGSCSNPDCKLTHKVIPERMQDCSYFLKGSCSSDNCPYRHVNVDPDSPVCESFLRGYCPDGNECRKKHTYVCPAFEATGICLQASTCKLHHPKKKTEKKPATEEKIVRGRYFDGGLTDLTDNSMEASERVFEKGEDENEEGKFPDFISLDVSDDEMQKDTVEASM